MKGQSFRRSLGTVQDLSLSHSGSWGQELGQVSVPVEGLIIEQER